MTQILALLLGRIRQPRVISEVIGGVILGPTIMGRIPGFTNAIFPKTSIPFLSLTSTIGLVFFLFLVGLELDVRVVRRNAKASSIISVTGLVIPLGLGAALAVPLYDQFIEQTVNRGYFILFVSVAVGITAFPVLCRILTEVKLLDTTVGVLVLSAGVGNDVVGWILLALAVALVNASTGLTALYVLLTGLGFVLFLLFPVSWGYKWCARKFGGLERGEPTAMMMTITLIMVLFSAFFTDIIGIHPIFGTSHPAVCHYKYLTSSQQVDFWLGSSFLNRMASKSVWWRNLKISLAFYSFLRHVCFIVLMTLLTYAVIIIIVFRVIWSPD
jgi:Kef-type K+ transport system membrane component KefB